MGTFTAGTTQPSRILAPPAPPGLLLPALPAPPGQPCPPTRPANARLGESWPQPGPPCAPTRPAVPADQARRVRRPGPPCPPTLPVMPATQPAKPAKPPSRADQPGHVLCFGRDAVDPASLVSSSFLLISASELISRCCCLKMSPFLATPLKLLQLPE